MIWKRYRRGGVGGMREIKFRAWSKKEKRMVYLSKSMTSSTHLQLNNHSWGIFEPDREDYCGGATLNNHFGDVLMQYTGLKDKNGKEIYEGDLITIDQEDEEDIFKIEWNNDTARFIMTSYSCYMCDFDNYSGSECEVIGNVHENPDLIEWEEEN